MTDHLLDGPPTGGRGQHSTSDTGTAAVNDFAEALTALARDLEAHDEPTALLPAVVAAGVALVPGAEDGSISAVRGRRQISSEAPTSGRARLIDAIQQEVGQGPCLDSAYVQQTVRIDDMSTELRWPRFAARAAHAGVGSMLSLQLFVEGDDLGALNLSSPRPGAFDDDSEQMGLLVAAHAAIAYSGVLKQTQLAAAVVSRDVIGQAKGILMERYHISGERAFLVLTRISQASHRKLVQIAAELVDTGTINGLEGLASHAPGKPEPLP